MQWSGLYTDEMYFGASLAHSVLSEHTLVKCSSLIILCVYMQKYFSSNTIQNGISTSGYVQEHTIQHITDGISNLVEENDLINFFKAPSMEEQAKCFKKFYSGLEDTVLLVKLI